MYKSILWGAKERRKGGKEGGRKEFVRLFIGNLSRGYGGDGVGVSVRYYLLKDACMYEIREFC